MTKTLSIPITITLNIDFSNYDGSPDHPKVYEEFQDLADAVMCDISGFECHITLKDIHNLILATATKQAYTEGSQCL